MSLSDVFQWVLLFFTGSAVTILWARMRRSDGDDPRMSRSLQLLQSKIAILEDLSDKIDEQLAQASTLMDHKRKELDLKLGEIDRTLHEIHQSREKSLEVARIFQDKIPHQEIIERQRTREYVKAARMAHAGASVSEISEQVSLPPAEIELIAKMNREQLQFAQSELPAWVDEGEQQAQKNSSLSADLHIEFPAPKSVRNSAQTAEEAQSAEDAKIHESLSALGAKFRMEASANGGVENKNAKSSPIGFSANTHSVDLASQGSSFPNLKVEVKAEPNADRVAMGGEARAGVSGEARAGAINEAPTPSIKSALKPEHQFVGKTPNGKSVVVQKIVFPKIEVNQHLS